MTVKCPKCGSNNTYVLCWVAAGEPASKYDYQVGQVIEAAGDMNHPPLSEPKNMASCGACDTHFEPPYGKIFRVNDGKPQMETI